MKWNGWLSFPHVFLPGNGPYIIEGVIGLTAEYADMSES